MQFAARQHGLEHVAGVHRTLGFSGADHRVNLVDEEDDLALRLGDFLKHRFETFLEFAAKLRAGDERAEVERNDLLLLQTVRHIARHNAARESFHDGSLADARLADEHGIVLRAAGENLGAAANLRVATDDRIELVLLRELREVAPVFFERLVGSFGVRAGHALVATHFGERFEKLVAAQVEALEDLSNGRAARLIEHGEHEMLDADIFVLETLGFVLRLDEQLVQALRDVKPLTRRRVAAHAREPVQLLFDLRLEQVRRGFGLLEQPRDQSAFLLQQRQRDVLHIDGLMLAARGDVLRIRDRALGFLRKLV